MFASHAGRAFRNTLGDGGFKPVASPETDEFIAAMQEMARSFSGPTIETNHWLWQKI
jgi:hypothetical protein